MDGMVLQQGDVEVPIVAANDPAAMTRGAVAFSRAWGGVAPRPGGASISVVGRRITAISRKPALIPLAGAVVVIPEMVGLKPGGTGDGRGAASAAWGAARHLPG